MTSDPAYGRKPFYQASDVPAAYAATLAPPGEYPFTRGTRAASPPGSDDRDGTILRELSGEGPPSRSNAQFRYLLEHGATGLDVIGDGPTVLYLDPDHPHAQHAVGNTGVSICRGSDFKELYDKIPLDTVSISHSLPSGFAIAGIYLAARTHGHDPSVLRGSTILAPLYGEDTGYAGNLPLELHMRLATDSIAFAAEHMPRFHPFVEDTYFISDGSVGPIEEMALGFVEIREVTRRLLERGLPIDSFAPRIALLVNCGMSFFDEIAKIRAARRLFATMMREDFGATDSRSMAVNIAAHTSGASMTNQQLTNNIVRGTSQALALHLAGVRAMEISAFDEPIRTPSREAHIVGLRTQQIVQLETGVADVADPLGGSYYVEALTEEFEHRIAARVAQIESVGDVATSHAHGYFRGIFHEAMVARATEVSSGERRVVGVNCHAMDVADDTLLRDVAEDRIEPHREIVESVRAWKSERDQAKVIEALAAFETVASVRENNLVDAIIDGFESDLTMGEMAGVLRQVHGAPYDPLGGMQRPGS